MLANYPVPIDQPTPEIAAWHARWRKNRDFVAGSDAVKSRSEFYLPKVNWDDGAEHYGRHLKNTIFYPATSKIALGMEGLIRRKPALMVASDRVVLLARSITPRNHSLDDLSAELVRETLITNYTGLLADHPSRDGFQGLNAANADRKGYRSRLSLYRGESILEVTEGPVGLNHQLIRVRIMEDQGRVVRVLIINDDGFYEQRVHRADENGQISEDHYTSHVPRIDGEPLTQIPFTLVNTHGTTLPGPSILESTVDLNLDHYRLSGQLANLIWNVSGPMLAITGYKPKVDANGVEQPLPDIGPNSIVAIEEDTAKVYWNTFDPKNAEIVTSALASVETKLSTTAHSILAPEKAAPESPDVILLRRVAEYASLAGLADLLSKRIEQALVWFALWVDGSEVTYSLNKDFQPSRITSSEHKELRDDYLAGAITLETYLSALQQGEILDPTLDVEVQAELARGQQSDLPSLGL